ncbi:MAG: PAS domain-containing protein [candidate division Zixibacteria bacterium]|nr:PAS domain-containing protein [candidate division Zixibacteria bacterium]
MKTPGILYRISFLVVLNSIFIFVAVAFVSVENNQAKIDRLISYRYDFISQYFYSKIDELNSLPVNEAGNQTNEAILLPLFEETQPFMKGLAGLSLLKYNESKKQYRQVSHVFRDELTALTKDDINYIAGNTNFINITTKGIDVGQRIELDETMYKTIYIPWKKGSAQTVLAISYLPEELVGSDIEYNTTLIILFLTITLICLLIVNLLFKDFIRPLQHLVFGMEKTAHGEVLYQIEDVKSDEMGRVAMAFNTMSSSLWEQRKMLTASNRNLTVLNDKMTETLSQLAVVNNSLTKSESFLAKLISSAPFPVIVTDTDKKIITFSDTALKTFETTSEAVLGKDFTEVFPFAPDKVFPESEANCRITDSEMICKKTSGEHFPVLMTRAAIRETNGEINGYLFFLRDISESKSFQEMIISIDRMATRGEMAGEIAHEINNYLAIILGNVELLPLLLAKGKMDKVDHKLGVLRQTVTKIQRFSEGLMGYGDDEAIFIPGDLNQLVENMVAFLRPQNRYDEITWELCFSADIPLVEFDSSQMQQLLVNLFNNAADALKDIERDKKISISTNLSDDGKAAGITISDNADGLPDDIHEEIFKQRYTGPRRGRGFGLFIAKQIMDKHAGDIKYMTSTGQGTSFTLLLPINKKIDEPVENMPQVIS